MPALSEILAHLAGGLRDNGALFAPRVLDIMSAATTFLLVTNTATDSDIAAASYLAAQLRSDDAKKAAAALGISPDLIPALSPTPAGVDHQLGQVLEEARRSRLSWRRRSCSPGTPLRQGRETPVARRR